MLTKEEREQLETAKRELAEIVSNSPTQEDSSPEQMPGIMSEFADKLEQPEPSLMERFQGGIEGGVEAVGQMIPEEVPREPLELAKGMMLQPPAEDADFMERGANTAGKYGPSILAALATVNPQAGLAMRAGQAGLAAGAAKFAQTVPGTLGGDITPGEALKESAGTAASFAASEVAVATAVATAVKSIPLVSAFGSVLTKIKPAKITAALENLEDAIGAKAPQLVADSYEAFQKFTGLQSLKELELAAEQAFSPAKLFKLVTSTMKKIKAGKVNSVSSQDLYLASQSAARLKQLSKYKSDGAAVNATISGTVSEGRSIVNQALQNRHPEYASLRRDYFFSKLMSDDFSNILPRNVHGGFDALRTWSNTAFFLHGAQSGGVGQMLLLPGSSPLALKAGLYGAKGVKKALPAIKSAIGSAGAKATEGKRGPEERPLLADFREEF